jgi:hypothetical protein
VATAGLLEPQAAEAARAGEEVFVPTRLVFHGDFTGGYHMIDSIPERCTMDYIRRYLEQVRFVSGSRSLVESLSVASLCVVDLPCL